MDIAISGFPAETTEDEIREALEEYGVTVKEVSIELSNNPQRNLATVGVDLDESGARVLAKKINGSFYKGQRLRAENYLLFK
ncbi:MAG: RNA-binding protein [Pseudomonadota bacterium]|nr:RNA-binding protein [Pseudomonadota bacterium]